MKKKELILLFCVLISCFTVRLYKFDSSLADWHSWRQVDTSAVSRTFAEQGFDLLHPRFHDLSNVPSGKDNPQGFRMVEFPLYNFFHAWLFKTFGVFSLESWGRILTAFFSTVSTFFIFVLVRKYSNAKAAFFSAFFFSFIPFNIYYGRVILPDPGVVMATLGGIYFFSLSAEKSSKLKTSRGAGSSFAGKNAKLQLKIENYLLLIVSLLFTSSAFLFKPYALFFVLPIVYLAWYYFGFQFFRRWEIWLFAMLAITPLLWWRKWIAQYPEGIPANSWLLNGNGIRFRPAFFRWMVYERFIKLISGYAGFIIAFFGSLHLFHMSKKRMGFFLSFIVGSVLYVTIFATGNVQHDYYQILIMPSVAILFGLGADYLWRSKTKIARLPIMRVMLVVLTCSSFYLAFLQVKDFYNINNPVIVRAGKEIDKILPKNAKIIAILPGSEGDTTFLYHTRRQGWASFQKPLPEMIEQGATYLVLANPKEYDRAFGKTYKIVKENKDYLLFKLQ